MPSGGKLSACAAVQRVRARGGFRQGVRAHNFSGGEARQVFIFLFFGAEVDDGQHADAAVRAPSGGKAGVFGNVIGDDGGSDFIHFEAAVGFGNFDAAKAKFAGLFQKVAGDGEILVLDLLDIRKDLIDSKLLGCLPDELVLFGEVFRRENIFRRSRFEQKAAAGNSVLRNRRGRCHVIPPSKKPPGPAGRCGKYIRNSNGEERGMIYGDLRRL